MAQVLYCPRIARANLTYHPVLKLLCMPIPGDDDNRNRAPRSRNEIGLNFTANSFLSAVRAEQQGFAARNLQAGCSGQLLLEGSIHGVPHKNRCGTSFEFHRTKG